MPQAARETFGAGLVQREATRITGLLRDRRAPAVPLVTLAEEMPVIETLEMRGQLTGALQLPLGYVIANRLHRRHFDPAAVERLRVAATAPAPERALLHCVAERAAEESGWSDINAASLARLRAGIGDAPLVELPFLFVEEFARTELEQVARLLEAGMAGRGGAPPPECPTRGGGGPRGSSVTRRPGRAPAPSRPPSTSPPRSLSPVRRSTWRSSTSACWPRAAPTI